MDVLSEVLKVVKLQGAMFYNVEFSAPWSFRSPPSCSVAPFVAAGAEHVIIYHLLTEGHASARLEDGERIGLDAGDIVIFPHGDAHILENGPAAEAVDMVKELARIFSQGLKLSRQGGGGETTKFVCGFMACEPRLSQVFLSGLPPVFKVSIRNDASGRWLENSIRFSVNEAGTSRAGGEAVLAKLSEVLFVETLRSYIAQLPSEQTGWLAGARDSEVGQTLALMHRNPAHAWTVATLAKKAGISDLIRFSVNEAGTSRAGGEAVLAKLSEVLFVETLRSYIAQLPSEQTGWLAGARDSEVGQTLALMHRNPAHAWTVATLAKKAGI